MRPRWASGAIVQKKKDATIGNERTGNAFGFVGFVGFVSTGSMEGTVSFTCSLHASQRPKRRPGLFFLFFVFFLPSRSG